MDYSLGDDSKKQSSIVDAFSKSEKKKPKTAEIESNSDFEASDKDDERKS